MPLLFGASKCRTVDKFVSRKHSKKSELPDYTVRGSPLLISALSLDLLEKGNILTINDKSYDEKSSRTNLIELFEYDEKKTLEEKNNKLRNSVSSKSGADNKITRDTICFTTINPEGVWYFLWLSLVSVCYVYNCFAIPLRSIFPVQTPDNTPLWLLFDYICDVVYLMDIILIKPRIKYLQDGFWIDDMVLTKANYYRKWEFKVDVLSLLPTDLFYIKVGFSKPWLRVPRMLKIYSIWKLFDAAEKVAQSGMAVRTIRALLYMMYLIHLNACTYYMFSVWHGDRNPWAAKNITMPYLQCFYFATKTTTAMGRNPKPETVEESVFTSFSWLMGVFVFAVLAGQMRENIATATHFKTEYRKLVDGTLEYMRFFNVDNKVQNRVKLWLSYTLEQQQSLDEKTILDMLPPKMKTDIAIHVHFQTLKKVQMFQGCDSALLRDLVLKLRPTLFLPGDYICHKGEVGKEMYIVKMGEVLVMGGNTGEEVLAVLKEGSVFGEISLLALKSGNRRTADVKSRGFSNLFILSKADFDETIINYPDTQEILKSRAKSLMKENEERERQNNANATKNNNNIKVNWRGMKLPDPVCGLAGNTVRCLVTVHKRMN